MYNGRLSENSINPGFQNADMEVKDPNLGTQPSQIIQQPSYQRGVSVRPSERTGLHAGNGNRSVQAQEENLPTRGVEINPRFQQNDQLIVPKIESSPSNKNIKYPYNCPNLWVIYTVFFCIEIVIIIFLGFFFKFPEEVKKNVNDKYILDYQTFFNALQMIFLLGLGLLHAYLKHHTWTSLAVELFIGVFGIQLGLLFVHLWECTFLNAFNRREYSFDILMKAEFISFTTMVSVQGLIGKLTMPQYFVLSIFETFFAAFNYALNIICLKGIDDGGSLYVYCFGAFFSIGAMIVLYCCGDPEGKIHRWRKNHEGGSYYSSFIALVGTCLIWVFMPSMNSSLTPLTLNYSDTTEMYNKTSIEDYAKYNGSFRYKGVVNTLFGLIGSVITSFSASALFNNGRFSVDHVIFASITGGVVVAGSCCFNSYIYASIISGIIASALSLFLYWALKAYVNENSLFDTLGAGSIFGVPGFLGGLLTSILVASNNDDNFKTYIGTLKSGRELNTQAGIEVACTFITIGLSLCFGAITGIILRVLPLGESVRYFVDSEHFEEENEPFPEYFRPQQPQYLRRFSKNGNTELRAIV